MKKSRMSDRIFGLILAAIVGVIVGVVLVFSNDGKPTVSAEEIAGTWQCQLSSSSLGSGMLELAGFSEEELALVEDQVLTYFVTAQFTEDKHFSLALDHDATAPEVTSLLDAAFRDLYDGLQPNQSEEEFLLSQAQQRDADSYEEILAALTRELYPSTGVEEYDSGSYTLKDSEKIKLGSNSANYTYADGVLTLKFSDVTMVLHRAE